MVKPKSHPPASGSASLHDLQNRRIGRILVKMGRVTREQVHEALQLQQQRRSPLGQLLVEMGYITEKEVNAALAAQAGMETLDLDKIDIPDSVAHILPAETARAYQVLPLKYDEASNTLTVALKDTNNFRAIDDLQLLMGDKIKPVIADASQVERLLARFYDTDTESLTTLIGELGQVDPR